MGGARKVVVLCVIWGSLLAASAQCARERRPYLTRAICESAFFARKDFELLPVRKCRYLCVPHFNLHPTHAPHTQAPALRATALGGTATTARTPTARCPTPPCASSRAPTARPGPMPSRPALRATGSLQSPAPALTVCFFLCVCVCVVEEGGRGGGGGGGGGGGNPRCRPWV